jgi:hypothetical protein
VPRRPPRLQCVQLLRVASGVQVGEMCVCVNGGGVGVGGLRGRWGEAARARKHKLSPSTGKGACAGKGEDRGQIGGDRQRIGPVLWARLPGESFSLAPQLALSAAMHRDCVAEGLCPRPALQLH